MFTHNLFGLPSAAISSPVVPLHGLLPPPLEAAQLTLVAVRPKFQQRSAAHISHARLARSKAIAVKRQQSLQGEKDFISHQLDSIVALLSSAGRLVGKKIGKIAGRKPIQELKPSDFKILVRANHLKAKQRVNVGIGFKRLQLLSCRTLRKRQTHGVIAARRSLASRKTHSRRTSITYCQTWDGVDLRFRLKHGNRYRQKAKTTVVPMLTQRGYCLFQCADENGTVLRQHEPYIIQAVEVGGTKHDRID